MHIIISNSSSEAIYTQITNQIKKQIVSEELKEGALLPSIRKLAKDLQISVITTKRAYEELEKEGLVHSVPGKGFFVAAQNQAFLKEKKIKFIEEKLLEVITECHFVGISLDELMDMTKLLYEDQ
ncbi:GntR family transcriptional regulator [Natranaerovirga pectinivora]|uniref:GntR family transcriptional regulator n=1 Tax=Natranaerovirga pectinivora TaxID=682400 RepID=A0A4R3MRY0_9FIRM|nr:GntR family transcriptional regulator [Natranaerovirga pectinivora]TCT16178.1 GntR family transcriptional regulator [Natranaerovirga pectinivora]